MQSLLKSFGLASAMEVLNKQCTVAACIVMGWKPLSGLICGANVLILRCLVFGLFFFLARAVGTFICYCELNESVGREIIYFPTYVNLLTF